MLRHAYQMQRANAERRRIKFLLTFEQWLAIWKRSKRLPLRGRGSGRYVMARIKDFGAYCVGNVQIILFEKNVRDARKYKTPEEIKSWNDRAKKVGYLNRGRKRLDLTELNQSRTGISLSREHRQNISTSMTGKTRGPYKTWKGIPRC